MFVVEWKIIPTESIRSSLLKIFATNVVGFAQDKESSVSKGQQQLSKIQTSPASLSAGTTQQFCSKCHHAGIGGLLTSAEDPSKPSTIVSFSSPTLIQTTENFGSADMLIIKPRTMISGGKQRSQNDDLVDEVVEAAVRSTKPPAENPAHLDATSSSSSVNLNNSKSHPISSDCQCHLHNSSSASSFNQRHSNKPPDSKAFVVSNGTATAAATQHRLIGAANGMSSDGSVDLTSIQTIEIWTGVSYAVAAFMLDQGLVDEGFRTAEGVYRFCWERLGLQYQTPEAVYKNGSYRAIGYMRPLSIWLMEFTLEKKRRQQRLRKDAEAENHRIPASSSNENEYD